MTAVLPSTKACQDTPDGAIFTAAIGSFAASVDPNGCVTLEGVLDVEGVSALRAVLDQALFTAGDITIDATGLSFIAKSAITELLCFQLFAAVEERALRLVGMSPQVASAIDDLDLRPLLGAPDAEDAASTLPLA